MSHSFQIESSTSRYINPSAIQLIVLATLFNLSLTAINSKSKEGYKKPNYSQLNMAHYLQIQGRVKQVSNLNAEYDKILDSVKIQVFNEARTLFRTFYTNIDGAFSIKLPLHNIYQIHFSKNGLVSKTLKIDTRRSDLSSYLYRFEIDLFEEIKDIDVSVLQNPIAEVYFNQSVRIFDCNLHYSDSINSKLKKEYAKYYRKQSRHKNIKTPLSSEVTVPVKKIERATDTSARINPSTNSIKSSTENIRKEINIVYQIQIMTLAGHLPFCAKAFRDCGKISEYIVNRKYVYAVGTYSSVEAAQKDTNRFKLKGFQDAFPVAIVNGILTPIPEALALLLRD